MECVFCYDDDKDSTLIKLPCACKFGYVHESCLHKWRSMSAKNEETCTTCQTKYNIPYSKNIDYDLGLAAQILASVFIVAFTVIFLDCALFESSVVTCCCLRNMQYLFYGTSMSLVLLLLLLALQLAHNGSLFHECR